MDYVVKQMLQPAIKTAISISAAANRGCWVNEEENLSAGFPHIRFNACEHTQRHAWRRLLLDFHTVTVAVSPDSWPHGGFPGADRGPGAPNRWENN